MSNGRGDGSSASAKYRNVGVNPTVSFMVDDAVAQGAAGMRFLEIRGRAEQVSVEAAPAPGLSSHLIRIHPRRAIGLNIDPDRPGLHTQDLHKGWRRTRRHPRRWPTKQARGGDSSRYEIVSVLAPTQDVAVAHVRRVALDVDGNPLVGTSDVTGAFPEMALYVLVRHGRTWWFAAGQNTLVRPPPI